MATSRPTTDPDDLKRLESRIDDLIATCERLKKENDALRSQHSSLNEKHSKLAEKTRVARERIETMITRLKALDRTA
jgi:cell division protein ZapB